MNCSVIIPSYQSERTIRDCLRALEQQDLSQPYEIILVDSGNDATASIVRQEFPQVQLIHLSQQTGPELARNIGARMAHGEILAFIDSDCVAAPDWLRGLHTAITQGYDAIGGAIANGNGETSVSWAGYLCEFREFLPGAPARDASNLTLGNVAYRRDRFWAAGGFPVGCFPQEDQVFHHTLRQQHARIRLDPQIVVAHMHRSERTQFFRHQRRIGQANARVLSQLDLPGAGLARHPWLALMVLPLLIVLRFIRTISACLHVEHALVLRRPSVAFLCLIGMCWWGMGFLETAFREPAPEPVCQPA